MYYNGCMFRKLITNRRGTAATLAMVATAFMGFAALFGLVLIPGMPKPPAEMRIEPMEKVVGVDNTFEIEVVVSSLVPTNVFAGELHFNHEVLSIQSIDYNTSIADLWAELPWYSNGDGTLTFGGGTTREGGFVGNDTLITVTFKTKQPGEGVISLVRPRILLHDGLGTDVQLVESRDAIFTISNTEPNLVAESTFGSTVTVAKEKPSTDLNNDGKQSIADVSIFMIHMIGYNERYDFNLDGEVGLKDLNILLGKG